MIGVIRVGIIFGGKSSEHEVSLLSAVSVIKNINKEKYEIKYFGITKDGQWKKFTGDIEKISDGTWEKTATDYNIGNLKDDIDFAFPVLHGPFGEDGTIQGLFEMLDIPYAGCGVLASACAMDKGVAKDIFAKAELPMCKHALLFSDDIRDEHGEFSKELIDREAERLEKQIGYPMFIKPANMGSSVGITKVKNREDLYEALKTASRYDRRILVEEGLNCRELETGVVGNFKAEAGEVGEILTYDEFYDYDSKYTDGKSQICIPANITKEEREEIRNLAIRAYTALDCTGFARADFFMDKETWKIYINEINSIPGFTKYSMFPLLMEAAGMPYDRLIERIIEYGYERYNAKNSR